MSPELANLFNTPRSASSLAIGLAVIEVPRSAWTVRAGGHLLAGDGVGR
jgi:hypothetical protein